MRHPSQTHSRSQGPGHVLGVLLIAGGIVWLLAETGVAAIPLQVLVAMLLTVMGLGMILTRSSRGFVFLGALMVAFLAIGSSDATIRVRGFEGVGERVVRPDRVAALASDYSMGAGQFTLDLSSIEAPDGVTRVRATLGVGEMVVIVPPGVGVEGNAEVVVGEVIAFEKTLGSGFAVEDDLDRFGSTASTLRLDLNVGLGTIEIRRGS